MTDTMPPGDDADDADDADDPETGDAGGGGEEPDPETGDAGGGGEEPDPERLDELGQQIGQARSSAEETIGGIDEEEEPLYTESGEEEPSDDQTITPPG